MTRPRQMALTLFMLAFGYHNDAWRLPGSRSEEAGQLSLVRDMAQAAERAKLHAIFFADSNDATGLMAGDNRGASIYEPISVLSALSAHTEKIGLIGTASTTYGEPYLVARQFAGLDLMSQGRAGWNVVTSFSGAQNFGMDRMPDAEERYRRATEFVDVATRLWDSWDDDALINDRESGLWADPQRLHRIDHDGEFYRVRGPLNMPRSPQGHPLIVQAGQSPAGIDLGTSVADVVYAMQADKARSIEYYADYKRRVAEKGRDPEKVKILPGIMPVVGETQADAEDLAQELADSIRLDTGRGVVERMLDVDVSDLDLGDKIPLDRMVDGPNRMDRWRVYRRIAEEHTLGEVIVELARAVGHRWMVGTPATIADSLIEWFDERACDGFNLNPPSVPVGMERMLTMLVPELQERGYFQDEYHGDTLRERLGVETAPRRYFG